jgi:molecular chaperone DnaK
VADGDVLAIDFGSTNTVAVLRTSAGRSRILLFDGSPLLPSAVFATRTGSVPGELLVGRDAAHMARDDPARYEPNPKRRIDDGTVLLGDRPVPVVDLVGAVLHRVAAEATRTAGTLPPVVLTHPVAWGRTRRQTLTEAARRAGLTVLGVVAEPIAAAAYFTAILGSDLPLGRCLAVFDLGGGTFDVAVVRRSGTGLQVVGAGGLDDVGGIDMDAAIIGRLAGQFQPQSPQVWDRLARPRGPNDLRDRDLFWQDARAAKEMLSRTSAATVHVPGLPAGTHLTRAEFDHLAEPLLARAVAETAATIRRCGLVPAQLAGLFLVGGSSRIPLASHLLHARLGIPPTVLEQPETAVAEGALHTDAAPRISPRVSQALDRLTPAAPAVPAAPAPAAPTPPSRTLRRTGLAIAAAVLVAAVGITLPITQPWHQAAGQTTGTPTPSAPASAAVRCPTNTQIQNAVSRDPGAAPGMTIGVQGKVVCQADWAAIHALGQEPTGGQDPVGIVERWTHGRWTDVVLGTELCSPESDGGPPNWSRPAGTVPTKVFTTFCKLTDYSTSPAPLPTG